MERSQRRTRYEFLLDIAVPWIDLQEPDIRDVLKAALKHLKRSATVAFTPDTPTTPIMAATLDVVTPST